MALGDEKMNQQLDTLIPIWIVVVIVSFLVIAAVVAWMQTLEGARVCGWVVERLRRDSTNNDGATTEDINENMEEIGLAQRINQDPIRNDYPEDYAEVDYEDRWNGEPEASQEFLRWFEQSIRENMLS